MTETMATADLLPVYDSVLEATELPRLIRITNNLYAASFSLMKLLPARYILEKAEAAGEITPGTPVIETSSGTFGLGLALVCRRRGYPLTVVGDPVIDSELRRRLEMLGARVEIVEDRGGPGGIQAARLARVEELRRERPDSFIPRQYDNPDNAAAYGVVGERVAAALGSVGCLVGPVGSGGSTGGIAASLRCANPGLHLVGVDTHGSIIFGAPEETRLLRGLGSSIVPGNVEHVAYDEVHWVMPGEAFHATHDLYRTHGLFMGPSSGASYQVARWWAAHNPYETVLMVLPDEGHRYMSTVYSREWLDAQGLALAPEPAGPRDVEHPRDVAGGWCRMIWARRGYDDVVGVAR